MPNRMIRDGILESEAVLSLPVEARWLYVSILLSGDDAGLFEATPFKLARRADVRREHADKLLGMLVDADLVRMYRVGGKQYGFIPKYGQRLQMMRGKHPLPPIALVGDDSDALNKINNLASKQTVSFGDSPLANRDSPPEAEAEAEVIHTQPTAVVERQDLSPPCPHAEIVALYAKHLPTARQIAEWTPARQAVLRARWREKRNRQNIDWWDRFFSFVAESKFLTGRVNAKDRTPFLLSLDWLLKPANFLKVIEGAYHAETA